jgi:beta-xylosidase
MLYVIATDQAGNQQIIPTTARIGPERICLPLITSTPISTGTNLPPSIDEFNNTTLDSRWSWVREDDSHWSLTTKPGSLRIVAQNGDIYGTTNDLRNLLLQTPPSGDFTISTLLSINPDTHAQQAGLFIYQDDSNYIRLTRGFMYSSNRVEFILEQNDIPTVQFIEETSTTIYLAISKYGTRYAAYFSVDGKNWTVIGEFTNVAMQNIQIGISAFYGGTANEIPVDFDFFQVTSN